MYAGDSALVLQSTELRKYVGKINLLFTSPPFPLNRKKKYGNKTGRNYVDWLVSFGQLVKSMLAPNGSFVIEMGNSWQPGQPVMSTLAVEALLAMKESAGFHLCQEFIWHNPARLPTPAQWVNIERIRLKDSFTRLWWMSACEKPYADNRAVLQHYSQSMRALLKRQRYNSGVRPSEHRIGKRSFLRDNGGAIPSNVLTFANTATNDAYQVYCRTHNLTAHPARMPIGLAEFFIKFLTKPTHIVLDPFAGSNTTGYAAERLGRSWLSIEVNPDYVRASRARFRNR